MSIHSVAIGCAFQLRQSVLPTSEQCHDSELGGPSKRLESAITEWRHKIKDSGIFDNTVLTNVQGEPLDDSLKQLGEVAKRASRVYREQVGKMGNYGKVQCVPINILCTDKTSAVRLSKLTVAQVTGQLHQLFDQLEACGDDMSHFRDQLQQSHLKADLVQLLLEVREYHDDLFLGHSSDTVSV